MDTIFITLDVIAGNYLALLGLDVLYQNFMTAKTVFSRFLKKIIVSRADDEIQSIEEWSVLLTLHDSQIYVDI